LRDILSHNMREEMEHACMALEWLRRNNPDWATYMKTYLFTEGDITELEEEDTGKSAGAGAASSAATGATVPGRGFTIGAITDGGEG